MFSHISFVCYKIICSFTAENHQNSPNIPETQTLIFLSCRGLVSITLECLFFCQLLSLSLSSFYLFKRQQQLKPAEPHFLSFLLICPFYFQALFSSYIERERDYTFFLCLSKRKPKTLNHGVTNGLWSEPARVGWFLVYYTKWWTQVWSEDLL